MLFPLHRYEPGLQLVGDVVGPVCATRSSASMTAVGASVIKGGGEAVAKAAMEAKMRVEKSMFAVKRMW